MKILPLNMKEWSFLSRKSSHDGRANCAGNWLWAYVAHVKWIRPYLPTEELSRVAEQLDKFFEFTTTAKSRETRWLIIVSFYTGANLNNGHQHIIRPHYALCRHCIFAHCMPICWRYSCIRNRNYLLQIQPHIRLFEEMSNQESAAVPVRKAQSYGRLLG